MAKLGMGFERHGPFYGMDFVLYSIGRETFARPDDST